MSDHNESAGALIYAKRTNRYLFLLRARSRYAGTWGIVGGKVEAAESVFQGLMREAREEIGQNLEKHKCIPLETFTADNKKFVYYTFLVTVDNEFVPVLNDEHRGYCWVEIDDYPKPLHPGLWRSFNFDIVRKKIKTLESILR